MVDSEDKKMRTRANAIRAKIENMKDRELVYFADSVYFSSFKSVSEYIRDIANEYDPTLPF